MISKQNERVYNRCSEDLSVRVRGRFRRQKSMGLSILAIIPAGGSKSPYFLTDKNLEVQPGLFEPIEGKIPSLAHKPFETNYILLTEDGVPAHTASVFKKR